MNFADPVIGSTFSNNRDCKFVKKVGSTKESMHSSIRGKGYLYCTIEGYKFLQSIQKWRCLSLFFAHSIGDAHSQAVGPITNEVDPHF